MNLKNNLNQIKAIVGCVSPLRFTVEFFDDTEIEITPKEYEELVPLLRERWKQLESRSNMRLTF